jgi:signal transduction histidine kinase
MMSYSGATAATPAREQNSHDPAAVVRCLADELRQPLARIESITHYLDMVLPRTEAKARKHLAKLRHEVRNMHWTLGDAAHLLETPPLNLHLLDLTEVVTRNLSEWAPAEAARLNFRLEPDLPLVQLDLAQMQRLLRNVVAFFQRVSAPNQSIVVRTYGAESEVVLEIASEVLEYSAADMAPLLGPFGSDSPPLQALAIATARRIAEEHGARTEAKMDSPHGLTLSIAFPAA